MVKTPSGKFTANIAEMDEAIRAAWTPIWHWSPPWTNSYVSIDGTCSTVQ